MDYKEHSKNNVDLLLESLLNGNGSGNDMDSAVFMGSTDDLNEFRMAEDIHKDREDVSPVAEDPITFNMNETIPLQFSLASADPRTLSLLSSSSSSSSSSPVDGNKLPSVSSVVHLVAENPIDKKNKQDGKLAIEAFVLPNDQISNDTKLLDFVVPVNALERSTGLNLLQAVNKNSMVPLCKEVNCQIVVRDFSNKMNNNNKQKSLPPKK